MDDYNTRFIGFREIWNLNAICQMLPGNSHGWIIGRRFACADSFTIVISVAVVAIAVFTLIAIFSRGKGENRKRIFVSGGS